MRAALLALAALSGCLAPAPLPATDRVEDRYEFLAVGLAVEGLHASYAEPVWIDVGPRAAALVVERNGTGDGGVRAVGPGGAVGDGIESVRIEYPQDGSWRIETWWRTGNAAHVVVRVVYGL